MKSLEIIGFKRANLGKSESKRLRAESMVPCVLYGGEEQVHFYAPAILFRDLVYSPEVYQVNLNIEGDQYTAVMQDLDFHPVNEMLMHVDFLQLQEDRPVKMEIPVRLEGTSPGVMQGGKMITKLRKIKVKALPKDLPDYLPVDISGLDLGKSAKVASINVPGVTILTNPLAPVCTVAVTRALRQAENQGK